MTSMFDGAEKFNQPLNSWNVSNVKNMSKIAPTIVIVGNHDLINNQQFLTENHWMNAMKQWDNVTVCDDVFVENNLFDRAIDRNYFFSIEPENFHKLFDPIAKDYVEEQ